MSVVVKDLGRVDQEKPEHPGGFSEALTSARERVGVSMAELAARVGCARSYVSMLERGERGEPSAQMAGKLEAALGLGSGELVRDGLRRELRNATRLDEAWKTGALVRLVTRLADATPGAACRGGQSHDRQLRAPCAHTGRTCAEVHTRMTNGPCARTTFGTGLADDLAIAPASRAGELLPRQVPLINRVAAGVPTEFTDLGYPARVADEYVLSPALDDPDAFAARVVGDSMSPRYLEGDIVVFSPARAIKDGSDCFVRLEPDHETTFKRVRLEEGGERVRLEPLNAKYAVRVVDREMIAGMYAAVSVTRAVGGDA